jgi:ATP-dependent DNA helicase RecG
MSANLLQTPIDYLKGVGPNRADLLRKELGIHTYQDLINFFPNRYIDKTRYYKINELQQNTAEIQLIGRIVHLRSVDQKKGSRLVADFIDETGKIELVWFRGQKWIRENLKINTPYVIFGKANWYNGCSVCRIPKWNFWRNTRKPFAPQCNRFIPLQKSSPGQASQTEW